MTVIKLVVQNLILEMGQFVDFPREQYHLAGLRPPTGQDTTLRRGVETAVDATNHMRQPLSSQTKRQHVCTQQIAIGVDILVLDVVMVVTLGIGWCATAKEMDITIILHRSW